ncbi:cyclic nucleotide-binding domain-containing protein [uncultured Jannaschia sp.]|uniref:cyclic nucleotide-binding domain-containing protein n=1 Tax=uncultured Jannaschia sp. TaxID=293347 RepID=UPI00260DECE8|nr:cyclic nucleotide-binding domain-containing protein [uncultured Jannaschia sp.]
MSYPWSEIFGGAPERSFPAGAALFRRGDPVQSLFLVRDGRVALRRALADGGALTLHVSGAGDVVALASLFANATHCDAVCETDACVAARAAAAIRDRLGTSPAASALADAAREVQALRARVEVLRLLRLSDRLDAYLDLNGPPKQGEWVRVADWIGVSAPAATMPWPPGDTVGACRDKACSRRDPGADGSSPNVLDLDPRAGDVSLHKGPGRTSLPPTGATA